MNTEYPVCSRALFRCYQESWPEYVCEKVNNLGNFFATFYNSIGERERGGPIPEVGRIERCFQAALYYICYAYLYVKEKLFCL